MARQPKTRQPKAKFASICLNCKQQVKRVIRNGTLVKSCGC